MTSVLLDRKLLGYNTAGVAYEHRVQAKYEAHILTAKRIEVAVLDLNLTHFTTSSLFHPWYVLPLTAPIASR